MQRPSDEHRVEHGPCSLGKCSRDLLGGDVSLWYDDGGGSELEQASQPLVGCLHCDGILGADIGSEEGGKEGQTERGSLLRLVREHGEERLRELEERRVETAEALRGDVSGSSERRDASGLTTRSRVELAVSMVQSAQRSTSLISEERRS